MKITKSKLLHLTTVKQFRELMDELGEPLFQTKAASDYRYYLFTRYVLAEKEFPKCKI